MTARVNHGSGQLHDLLIDNIGRQIVAEELPAGEIIVPAEIAQRYNVSAAVVREALRVLAAKGLLEAKRRAGTRVTDDSQWDFLDPQVITWRLSGPAHREQIQELLNMRQAMEPLAVKLVTERPAPELIQELTHAVEAMAGAMASKDLHRFTEADISFHTAIFAHCGNRMLSRLSSVISTALKIRETLHLPFVDQTRHGLDMHARLVSEIAEGNKEAESTMREIVDEFDYENLAFHGAPQATPSEPTR